MSRTRSLIPDGVVPQDPTPEQMKARQAYLDGRRVINRPSRKRVSQEAAEFNSCQLFERIARYD